MSQHFKRSSILRRSNNIEAVLAAVIFSPLFLPEAKAKVENGSQKGSHKASTLYICVRKSSTTQEALGACETYPKDDVEVALFGFNFLFCGNFAFLEGNVQRT